MTLNYEQALEIVMSRHNQTYGIDHLIAALESLGNPHDSLKTIHIAGTNGKGSTTNYTRSILQKAGFKVGSFTSPHLVTHNDRIRINNVPISDEAITKYINETRNIWESFNLSMFEIDMLISVLYFKEMQVDYVVYEVGLGGRLDATNVITPLVSAITNVGLDHQNILGNTIAEIAVEKAGIIKRNVPIITTAQDKEVLEVIINKAMDMESRYKQICIPYYHIKGKQYLFDHENITLSITNQGVYQVGNAALAVSIIKEIEPKLSDEIIQQGIEESSWPGRFEEMMDNVFIDGAHNEMGIQRLVQSMQILPRPWTVVFTALKDKDTHHMLQNLVDSFDKVIVTEFDFYRASTAEALAESFDVEIIKDSKQAIDAGLSNKKEGTLVVTGSLYFISEAREYLLKKRSLQTK